MKSKRKNETKGGAKKLKINKQTVRDLDARGQSDNVKGGGKLTDPPK